MRKETIEVVYQQLREMGFDKDFLRSFDRFIEIYLSSFNELGDVRRTVGLYESSNVVRLKDIIERLRQIMNDDCNFIPGDVPDKCRPNCIAIASLAYEKLRVGKELGAKGALQELISYWFNCFSINSQNILYVSDWNSNDFKLHFKKMLDAYNTNNGKKTAIIEVSDSGLFLRYPY
jgi:hypothetical protein